VIAHLHSEADCAPGNRFADSAEANDSQPLMGNLHAKPKLALRPPARTHEPFALADAARYSDHEPQSQISDAVVQDIGRIADDDAPRPRGADGGGVLGDWGFSAAEIARLQQGGIVGAEQA